MFNWSKIFFSNGLEPIDGIINCVMLLNVCASAG